MTSYSWNSNVSNFGSNCLEMLEPFSGNLGDLGGNWGGGSDSVSVAQSLVLDGERGELVKAPIGVGKKSVGLPEEKVVAALKSHSEAERRRRERINAHLNTLRSLVPCTEKVVCFSMNLWFLADFNSGCHLIVFKLFIANSGELGSHQRFSMILVVEQPQDMKNLYSML